MRIYKSKQFFTLLDYNSVLFRIPVNTFFYECKDKRFRCDIPDLNFLDDDFFDNNVSYFHKSNLSEYNSYKLQNLLKENFNDLSWSETKQLLLTFIKDKEVDVKASDECENILNFEKLNCFGFDAIEELNKSVPNIESQHLQKIKTYLDDNKRWEINILK